MFTPTKRNTARLALTLAAALALAGCTAAGAADDAVAAPAGESVTLTDGAGTDWVSDAPAIDGATVTAALDADMPDGGYEIRWRVVSSDGHPITGIVPFAVGDGEEPGAGPGPAAEAATPNSSQNQTAQEDEGPWRVLLVGAGGAAVAAALFALVHVLRRRSDARGSDDAGNTPDASGTL